MSSLRISLRIYLPNGARLGPGKIGLLEAIEKRRSISAAARDFDMSYRRAWLLIDELNHVFSELVVETYPGRSHGTGAKLTPFGERLVAQFRAVERRATKSAEGALDEILKASNADFVPGEATPSHRRTAGRGA